MSGEQVGPDVPGHASASKEAAATRDRPSKDQSKSAIVLSSLGLMADVYDFNVINLVRPNLEAEFGPLLPRENGLLTGASLAGAMLGQILFGAIADHVGRRFVFITTASLVALTCLCSAAAQDGALGMSIYTNLAIARFFMGLGIGGEYPLSAASTVENVDAASSGRALAMAYAGMALGMILAPCVVIALCALLGVHTHLVWRLSFAFGAVFATVLAFFRYGHLQETMPYQATSSSQGLQSKSSALWAMRWSLAGTAGSWLLYDIITYGVGLFTTTIFPAAPGLDSALLVLLIAVISFPGTLLAIPVAGFMHLRHVQLLGLGLMMLCFLLLARRGGGLGTESASWSCLLVFSCMRCFDNGGPGMTTFAVPGQIFPTRIRGTAHGISAASGKLGAVIGTFAFPYLHSVTSPQVVMGFMAAVSALTMLWTWIFIPLYTAEDMKLIAKHDGDVALERQAVLAERLLYARTRDKGESMPISMVSGRGRLSEASPRQHEEPRR